MTGHIDQIRRGYAALDRGDIRQATRDWADGFVWQGPSSAELPMGGEYAGRAAGLEVLQRAAGAWDEFRFSADEFFEGGETVVVLGHSDLRKGNRSATTPVVHIWRWEGDQITRFQFLTDTLQLAQLLGIATSGPS
jgi:uncharacterized protein